VPHPPPRKSHLRARNLPFSFTFFVPASYVLGNAYVYIFFSFSPGSPPRGSSPRTKFPPAAAVRQKQQQKQQQQKQQKQQQQQQKQHWKQKHRPLPQRRRKVVGRAGRVTTGAAASFPSFPVRGQHSADGPTLGEGSRLSFRRHHRFRPGQPGRPRGEGGRESV